LLFAKKAKEIIQVAATLVYSQPLLFRMRRETVGSRRAAIVVPANFWGQDKAVAPVLKGLPDLDLGVSINTCLISEVDAQIECVPDKFNRYGLIRHAALWDIGDAHANPAAADRRSFMPLLPSRLDSMKSLQNMK
jgi:hypothetical protein